MYDNSQHYGTITRALHWGMAILLVWQILTIAARMLIKDSPLYDFMWPTHRSVGTLLLLLAAIRIGWALINMSRRPAAVDVFARLGHLMLYGLLLAVPALGLARQYGTGRVFEPFGVPLFSGFEGRIDWLMAPGNLLHGTLGWILLVLIAGHITMAVIHRKLSGHQDVLPRMWGKR